MHPAHISIVRRENKVARSRPSYPPEFKEEAVRLVHTSDREWPIPKIACDLGVSPERAQLSHTREGDRVTDVGMFLSHAIFSCIRASPIEWLLALRLDQRACWRCDDLVSCGL